MAVQWFSLSRHDDAETDILKRLVRKLAYQSADARASNAYYDGEQVLRWLDARQIDLLGDKLLPLAVGWGQLVVDSVEERLDIEGFRYGDSSEADATLAEIWQANNLDEASQRGHLDALIVRSAFVIVGSNPDAPDLPMISVESPEQVAVEWDPQHRKVSAGIKQWREGDGRDRVDWASLYLPGMTVLYRKSATGDWVEESRDEHMIPRPLVVPLANRVRTLRVDGMSELTVPMRRLIDAGTKVSTDMMTSAEYHAMPRRWAMGLGPEDFEDENGNPTDSWQNVAGRIWTSENPDAKVGQFPESDLANFHNTIETLAKMIAALGCLPPQYVGLVSANPASADAIRSSEARLVKRAERKQLVFGGAWEDVMRLALRIRTGVDDPAASRMETLWNDPATPTFAQRADGTVKLVAAGIVPVEQAREDLGYTPTQQERMRAMDHSSSARILAGDFSSLVGPKPTPTPPAGMGGMMGTPSGG